MKLKSLHVIDMSGPEGQEKVRVMLARRSCKQPYSSMYVGETKVIVLWDTGCTLPGLMDHSRFMQLKKAQPESVGEVVWYKNKQPVSGISKPMQSRVRENDPTRNAVTACDVVDGKAAMDP